MHPHGPLPYPKHDRGLIGLRLVVLMLALLVVVLGWQAWQQHAARTAWRAAAPLAARATGEVGGQAQALATPMPAGDAPRQPGPLPARRSAGQNVDDPVSITPRGEPTAGPFRCDGRQHCSQMRSCEEATFFLRHCPNTKMDGDRDGVPCESQWCPGPLLR